MCCRHNPSIETIEYAYVRMGKQGRMQTPTKVRGTLKSTQDIMLDQDTVSDDLIDLFLWKSIQKNFPAYNQLAMFDDEKMEHVISVPSNVITMMVRFQCINDQFKIIMDRHQNTMPMLTNQRFSIVRIFVFFFVFLMFKLLMFSTVVGQ